MAYSRLVKKISLDLKANAQFNFGYLEPPPQVADAGNDPAPEVIVEEDN